MTYFYSKTQFDQHVEKAQKEGYRGNMKDRTYINGQEFTEATMDISKYLKHYPDAIMIAKGSFDSKESLRVGTPYFFYTKDS